MAKKKAMTDTTKAREADRAKKVDMRRQRLGFDEPPKPFAYLLGPRARVLHKRPRPAEPALEELCKLIEVEANKQLVTDCQAKEFTVESIFRPCGAANDTDGLTPVDLVILIDTSGSMGDEGDSLSSAADTAIQEAMKKCKSDLRVTWLGIEGTFPNTRFDTTLRDYLHSLGVSDSNILSRREADIGHAAREDGARGIQDICNHFDWRPGAFRAVFFLGDEPLEGGEPQTDADKVAADNAITTANSTNVKVFTYAGTGIELWEDASTGRKAVDEYERVATGTDGIAFSVAQGIGEFQQILEEIICASSGGVCTAVRLPEIRPCFTLRWGDGPSDHIETDDVEVLCLTASNPYTNVTLKNVTAFVVVVGPTGLPEKLPDGTRSVELKPFWPICFGDLSPCGLDAPEAPSSLSREIVLVSRGAKEGPYFVLVGYCYGAEFNLAFASAFPVELVRS